MSLKKYIYLLLVGVSITVISCESQTKKDVKTTAADVAQEHEDGPFEEFYTDGTLKTKGEYVSDKKVGYWVAYYPTGLKWSEGHYKNGLKNGQWVSYYENGYTRYVGHYEKDEQSGVWEYYDDQNNLVKKVDYSQVLDK